MNSLRLLIKSVLIISLVTPFVEAFSLPIAKDSLESGLVVLTYESPNVPVIKMRWIALAGSAQDPQGKEGLANFTNKILIQGTKTRSAFEIHQKLEYLGAVLSSGTTKDYSFIDIKCLKKDFDTVLEIFTEILKAPSFLPSEIEKLRSQILLEIKGEDDYPYYVGNKKFMKLIFKDHPYAHDSKGDTLSVKTITKKDIEEFYYKYYHLNNGFLVVVGDFDRQELLRKLAQQFSGFRVQKRNPFPPSITPGPFNKAAWGYWDYRPELNQSYIFLGFYGIPETSEDLLAVRVMNFILGGSPLVSRLGRRVRETSGLAYDVRSGFYRWLRGGMFLATTQTSDPERAIKYILEEIKKIYEHGVREDELARAKTFYLGNFPFNLDGMNDKLEFLLGLQLYGRGLDYPQKFQAAIKSLTVEQINKMARQYLYPDNYLLVVISHLPKDSVNIPGINWFN